MIEDYIGEYYGGCEGGYAWDMHDIQSLQAITGTVKFLASAKVRRPLSTKKQTDQNGQPSCLAERS